jgi:hypothetical protein
VEPLKARPKAIAARRGSATVWIDFLVLAAAALAFAAIAIAHGAPAPPSRAAGLRAQDVTVQTSQLPQEPDLIKARIRLATGGPWS